MRHNIILNSVKTENHDNREANLLVVMKNKKKEKNTEPRKRLDKGMSEKDILTTTVSDCSGEEKMDCYMTTV